MPTVRIDAATLAKWRAAGLIAAERLTACPAPVRDNAAPEAGAAALVSLWCKANGVEQPWPQHVFHPKRKWALDLAWPARKVGIEFQGGLYTGGKHVRPKGYENDCHKLNAAQIAGWTLLWATYPMVRDGTLFLELKDAIDGRK